MFQNFKFKQTKVAYLSFVNHEDLPPPWNDGSDRSLTIVLRQEADRLDAAFRSTEIEFRLHFWGTSFWCEDEFLKFQNSESKYPKNSETSDFRN